jgi:hypothetical protein
MLRFRSSTTLCLMWACLHTDKRAGPMWSCFRSPSDSWSGSLPPYRASKPLATEPCIFTPLPLLISMHTHTLRDRFGNHIFFNLFCTHVTCSTQNLQSTAYFFSRWPYALVAYSPFSARA